MMSIRLLCKNESGNGSHHRKGICHSRPKATQTGIFVIS
ncbi:hypothetical protein EAL2_c10160 [Peptoclostridium acidaminophilum DSM 3953]|uniref:Uncharacterized protein n=1 Tax=Peptoclostridium acidaminophilum DSM 3953 TaxID=1286171 RepID=W8T621_PEPAC|nr:hypothetical protein EAL2_c10160 [Peptoclostridium acidaminophilum DSM 3953]